MICGGPFAEVLVEYQLLFYIVFNVLTYPSNTPSSGNNVVSIMHFILL